MCGRYASSRSPEDLAEEFEVLDPRLERALPPSWNVAPTAEVYAVLERVAKDPDGGSDVGATARQLRTVRWGLVPSWAKDPSIGSRMINARAETLAEKPAFRKALQVRRCIVPADGYYEWYVTERTTARGKPVKQPYFITPSDGSVLAMAGLYEIWRDPTRADDDPDRLRWTCTVITTSATDELGRIHDRMPLMVGRDARDAWLDPTLTTPDLTALLTPAQQGGLTAFPVSAAVGSVANDGPELVRPLPLEELPTAPTSAEVEDDAQGRLL